ncbi:hypothetical protein JCM10295v2_003719 [Rhodotorula toruloides]
MSDFEMAKGSNEMTEHAEAQDSFQYRPKEHDGKKKDGSPDRRVSSEHGFGGNKELASEAGKRGGSKTQEDIGL